MPTSSWTRVRAVLQKGHIGAAVLAGALALAVSLTMSQYLNRDLLDEFGETSRLLERQQAVAMGHDAALAALLDLQGALLRSQGAGKLEASVPGRLAQYQQQLDRMVDAFAAAPAFAAGPACRDIVPRLQALTAALASLPADTQAGRALPAGALQATGNATEDLVRLGRALRNFADAERLGQQAAMIRLRTRTVGLSYLMCLMFSLTAAMATHGVLLARRESRTRHEADAARRDAVDASARAEAASRDKSKFLGMLSHELLTPLQSIISSMDIIESRGRIEPGEPLFLRLREGTRALRARMSDLVDFAKISSGRLAVSPRKFRLDRLVEEVIADHEEAVVRKDLDIHWEPGPDLRQAIVTDPRRVRQILDNLVSNAIKYTARGGVTVHALIEARAGRLCLEVRDTGVGIAPDALARIFDPFYRVADTAQLAEGSGLGLAVVHSLVELLHGHLHVESNPGEGTRFVVFLPVTTAAPLELASAPPLGLPPVLIVDDAHDVRMAVADVVRSLGYQPHEAGSGREALRALDERRFAGVLLDLQLPDLSGGDVARRVRTGTGPNRGTHLVMLSAAADVDEAVVALFDARVDKPVTSWQLQSALQPAATAEPAAS